ncbi:hypothetical protein BST95_00805 [Halioglobus japonicus]|uniref:Uncharacterized protein n=1 Tax=Halioglobus japonicus TaxID=930805 RepID=A0AAP8MBQ6_9GAMM|nr:hypothetical protein BST95_00805 [Halioglobus japonicus]PLW84863.1 hypothetical protein C0029_17865 [Halioglobus japonicus]
MEEPLSRSTISAPDLRWLLAAVFGLLLAGCGPAKVIVEGNFPPPLMAPLPMKLGIWYPEDFSGHEFFDQAKSRSDSDWLVQTGAAQVQMWDTLLAGMFVETVHMKGEPGPGQMNQLVDAVLIPEVDELQYAIPAHTNVKVYEIWMRYRFRLVTTGGDPITDWTMTAYGKTPTAFLQSDAAAVNLAAVMALRDAGANFATNFARVPEVKTFLDELHVEPLETGL